MYYFTIGHFILDKHNFNIQLFYVGKRIIAIVIVYENVMKIYHLILLLFLITIYYNVLLLIYDY